VASITEQSCLEWFLSTCRRAWYRSMSSNAETGSVPRWLARDVASPINACRGPAATGASSICTKGQPHSLTLVRWRRNRDGDSVLLLVPRLSSPPQWTNIKSSSRIACSARSVQYVKARASAASVTNSIAQTQITYRLLSRALGVHVNTAKGYDCLGSSSL